MVRRLPSLNALKAFEAAARHQSFSLAGGELNVSYAAVSRHIRELEGWLGTALFRRTGRGVELTEAGDRLARELTPAFDQLAAAVAHYNPTRGRRQLVITSEVSFAALWLVPRLGSFTSGQPETDLVVDPTNRLADLGRGEADFGIRYGKGTWPGASATKLIDDDLSVVCSPGLLAASRVRRPEDLAQAVLIQEDAKTCWTCWLDKAGLADQVVPSGPTLKGHLAIAAAESGQGFAIADIIQCADALLAGRLVQPFAMTAHAAAYYLVRSAEARECASMAAFRRWIEAELAATTSAIAGARSALLRNGRA